MIFRKCLSAEGVKIDESDFRLKTLITNSVEQDWLVEIGIAVFTPSECDKGESHVIEHCIAAELFEVLGNRLYSAYVLHSTTFYNFRVRKEEISVLREIFKILLKPRFLTDDTIFVRESCNVQKIQGKKVIGGVVYNEILSKSRDPYYVLLSSIPKILSENSRTAGVAGGTVEGILRLQYEDIVSYYNRFYCTTNMCCSILGNFSLSEEKKIKIFCSEICNSLIKKSECGTDIYSRHIFINEKIQYISDKENGYMKPIYCINFKLEVPETKEEYELYFWLKSILKIELKKICLSEIKVELRNLIDYAYICVIYDKKTDKAKIYTTYKEIFSEKYIKIFLSISTDYLWDMLRKNGKCFDNSILIKFLSEAYFQNLEINSFLKKKQKDQSKLNEQLRKIRVYEGCAYPLELKNYNTLIKQNIDNIKELSCNQLTKKLDWDKINFKASELKHEFPRNISYYYKTNYKGISAFFYKRSDEYTMLYYDISNLSNDEMFSMGIIINILRGKRSDADKETQIEPMIYPVYDFVNKISKSFLVLKVSGRNYEITKKLKDYVSKIYASWQYLYEELYNIKEFFGENLSKNIKSITVIRNLSKFGDNGKNKDNLYGLGMYMQIKKILNDHSQNALLSKSIMILEQVFEKQLKAIGVSYKIKDELSIKTTSSFIDEDYIHKIKTFEKKKNEIIVIPGENISISLAVDISSIDLFLLRKFKVLCSIITQLCLFPILREKGIYYGEVDIIDGILMFILYDSDCITIKEGLFKEVEKFLKINKEEISTEFSKIYYDYWSRKKRRKEEQEILSEICHCTLDENDLDTKTIELKIDELEKFENIIRIFPQKMTECIVCGKNRLKVQDVDMDQFSIIDICDN